MKSFSLPGAALLTPNLDEVAVLLRSSVNPGRDELPEVAARLAVRYGCPVLLKGGHLEGDCRDVLSGPDERLLGQWERRRVQDVSTHGTGCSLSAAVAARLATGDGLVAAVEARPGIHRFRNPEPSALGTAGPGGCAEIVVKPPSSKLFSSSARVGVTGDCLRLSVP